MRDAASLSLGRFAGIRPPVVLIGDLTLVRPLGHAGIPVVLVTADPDEPTLRSRYVGASCLVPGFEGTARAETLERLLAIADAAARELGCKLPLFCGSDAHLEVVYGGRRAIEEAFLVLLNDEKLAWALLDKRRFAALCERASLAAPKTADPERPLAEAVAELREPLLVKPRRKGGFRRLRDALFGGTAKARVFATRRELLAHPLVAAHAGELLVQELVETGPEGLLSFHAVADEGGTLLAWFCGKKLRTYPPFGGESAYIETIDAPEVVLAGRDVAAKLGLRGPFKIDFARDARTGELFVLEVNARFSLWHYLGAKSGVNLPAVAYEHLVYGLAPTRPARARPSQRWLHAYRDYHAFCEERGARASAASWLRSVAHPRLAFDVFAWDDPKPFFAWAIDHLAKRRKRRDEARALVRHPRQPRSAARGDRALPVAWRRPRALPRRSRGVRRRLGRVRAARA